MSNPIFPVLSMGQDSSLYDVSQENPAVSADVEGGYAVSRRRFTRTARKTFTTGYSDLTDADRLLLMAFWESVGGGSVIFDWTNPADNTVHAVRFMGKDPLQWKYQGMGYLRRWSVQFKVMQA